MGYSHYYYRKEELDKDLFEKAVEDCKKICSEIEKNGVSISGAFGTGKPDFNSKWVRFNGSKKEEGMCETFLVPRVFLTKSYSEPDENGRYFDFCKTRELPYDIAVVSCLIVFKHYFGNDFMVRSDGGNEGFAEAKKLCRLILGYGQDFVEDENE